jgi:predicted nucleic-acid-binding Zn-ribbon protein
VFIRSTAMMRGVHFRPFILKGIPMGLFGKKRSIFDSTKAEHFTDTYQIQGKYVICSQCGQNKFDQASCLLNTPGMTFFGLDWANRSATILSCKHCGRIEWFLREPEEVR